MTSSIADIRTNVTFLFCNQEDVSHHPGLVLRSGPGLEVHRADGHRPGG